MQFVKEVQEIKPLRMFLSYFLAFPKNIYNVSVIRFALQKHVHVDTRFPRTPTKIALSGPTHWMLCDIGWGWGPWPPTQRPRMREVFPDDTRIGGAPRSLVPPGTAPRLPTGPTRWQSRQVSEEEGICCVACTSGNGRRVARDGVPVWIPRVPFHQRRRRRGGHAPSHGHRGRMLVRVRNSANPCVRDMPKYLRTCQMSVDGYPGDMSCPFFATCN